LIGFDYGVKPQFLVIGDIEYTNLIHEAKPVAMGYGKLPYFGLYHEPPFACIVFENEDKGRECFQHFKKWAEGSKDGDAVSLSFIETTKGGYRVCVYPEYTLLVDRCVPKYLQPEVSQSIVASISFPLTVDKISPHYLFFKAEAKDKPFIFCGASRTGKLFLESAIVKQKVNFFNESEIPEHAPESAYSRLNSAENKESIRDKKELPKEAPEVVYKRRLDKLKTFLPITYEKLNYSIKFQSSKAVLLSEGFAAWQILQAACNIVVSMRICGKPHFDGLEEKVAAAEILEFLLNDFETPDDDFYQESFFSEKSLREQIVADSNELLRSYDIETIDGSIDVLLGTLLKEGLLNPNG
jgi:hypothetical protein